MLDLPYHPIHMTHTPSRCIPTYEQVTTATAILPGPMCPNPLVLHNLELCAMSSLFMYMYLLIQEPPNLYRCRGGDRLGLHF